MSDTFVPIVSGYYGFTVGTPVDENGQVDKCIIAIPYPLRANDVEVQISSGSDDWAIVMGDGTSISLSDPNVLYANRDNAIIEFKMDRPYPCNSPCTLIFNSPTADFGLEELSESKPFEENTISGHFAYTIEGYGGSGGVNGTVNRLMVTIPFPHQQSNLRVEISNGDNDWGVRMPNGKIIGIRNPEIVAVNSENAVAIFEMDEFYPSNTPCILVYRSQSAEINVIEIDDDDNFYPVIDIVEVPILMISGQTVDLNRCKIKPWNASNKKIDWSVVSGPGEIRNGNSLYAKDSGDITVRATIENALEGSDDVNDFVKTFKVISTENVITIDAQPVQETKTYIGKISEVLSVTAKCQNGVLRYQWMKNSTNTNDSGTPIVGATDSKYELPFDMKKGDYYYFCVISSPGAADVTTEVAHVYVDHELTSIRITPRPTKMGYDESIQLDIEHYPIEADKPEVKWMSSNSDVIKADPTGKISSNLLFGDIIITVETIDRKHSDSITINIPEFIPVSNITGVPEEIDTRTDYTLSGVVTPLEEAFNEITWSVIDPGTTGATITRGVLHALTEGIVTIEARIASGKQLNEDYVKRFLIKVNKVFVPVTDLRLSNRLSGYALNDYVFLEPIVEPADASTTAISWVIKDGSSRATMDSGLLHFNSLGAVTIEATIFGGVSKNMDYIKEFTLTCDSDKFISASSISIEFVGENGSSNIYVPSDHKINDEYVPVLLPYTVLPTNATNKDPVISLEKVYEQDIIFTAKEAEGDNVVYVKSAIDDEAWTETDKTVLIFDPDLKTICIDTNKFISTKYYKAEFKFVLANNSTDGSDSEFICVMNFYEDATFDMFVSLVNFDPMIDSNIRALTPMNLNKYSYTPFNLSCKDENGVIKDLHTDPAYITNVREFDRAQWIISIVGDTTDSNGLPSDLNWMLPFFNDRQWTPLDRLLIPTRPGTFDVATYIPKAKCSNPTDPEDERVYSDYLESVKVTVSDPFIPVKDLSTSHLTVAKGVPSQMYADIVASTGYREASWDDEVATNSDIVWSLKAGTTGATITSNGLLTVTTDDPVTVVATIVNGKNEAFEWYDETQEAEDFIKEFTVTTIDLVEEIPFMDITLTNGGVVTMLRPDDYSLLSNEEDENYQITVKTNTSTATFKKNEIRKVKFLKPSLITSLRNFGMNFTKLTSIENLPQNVSGPDCMRNFLRGCTMFNQDITIPSSVTGDRCLMYALRDCTSFNSNITIDGEVAGDDALHGFMFGCTSFDKEINIPETVTGNGAMRRFMAGCTEFNQPITLPERLSGYECLRGFMFGCTKFNQDITLPTNVVNEENPGRELYDFMGNCKVMSSTITVPEATGANAQVNNRTLAACDDGMLDFLTSKGVTFDGAGATEFSKKFTNNYPGMDSMAGNPFRHITNND